MSQTLIYLEVALIRLKEAEQQLERAENRYSVAQEAAYYQGTHEADVEIEVAYEIYQEKCGEVAQCEAAYRQLIELSQKCMIHLE